MTRDVAAYKVPYYVSKYRKIRHTAEELFKSERFFLPRCLKPGMRVLDIGCACGGFYNILHSFEPGIEYLGVDISEVLVEEARRVYPQGRFEVVDGTDLPFSDNDFDLVQAWGVTLHEPNYKRLLAEAWRLAREVVLFDVRLQTRGREVIDKERSFVLNPGGVRNYYIVPNAFEFLDWLLRLEPRPARVELFGYEGKANDFTTLPPGTQPLYMTGVGLFKAQSPAGGVAVKLDLPESLRRDLCRLLGNHRDICTES